MRVLPPAQTAEGRSSAVTAERMVNLYAQIESQTAKSAFAIYTRPGLTSFADVGTGPIRGEHTMAGIKYVVSGSEVYKISLEGVGTLLGSLTGSGPVTSADNGTQLVFVSGGKGWVATTLTLVEITDPDFPTVSSVTFLDGYHIFSAEDGKFYVSAINDATDYDALDFATAESSPDDLKRVFVDHRELWLFGEDSTEIWYSSGVGTPPFDRFNDTLLESGIWGTFAVTKNDNTTFWIDEDGVVQRANAYTPVRTSTHAVENRIANWPRDETVAFSFVMEGHTFIVFRSPIGTEIYDAASGSWFEWQTFGEEYWVPMGYSSAYNKHLVGSAVDGKVYSLDLGVYSDDGSVIRSEVQLPPIHRERQLIVMNYFEVDIESGVGITAGQGSDPQIMLQYSDDGGRVWSSELWRPMGKIGEHRARQVWRQMGMPFRERTIRLATTDPVKRVSIDYHAGLS